MEPAATIIDLLGGPTFISEEIGVHRTRVSNWKRPRERGGTGGTIPQRHIPALLALAKHLDVPLDLKDFFDSGDVPQPLEHAA